MPNGKYITNINADFALSTILGHFGTEQMVDMCERNLENNWKPYGCGTTPSIEPIEAAFQQLISQATDRDDIDSINLTRNDAYRSILNTICEHYNISVDVDDNNLYSTLYWIYNYFVANFANTVIQFYTNFLYYEKSSIYTFLELEKRKNDRPIQFSKKIIGNDEELTIIHANIPYILDELSTISLDMESFIKYGISCGNANIGDILLSLIYDNGNIVRDYISPYLSNPLTRNDIITLVTLELQKRFIFVNNAEESDV